MIAALAYDHLSQDQVGRLVKWLQRIGPFKGHSLILCVENRVSLEVVADLIPLFDEVEQIDYTDPYDHFPESKNIAFQQCAGYVASKYLGRVLRWLYLEPDAVPLRGTFLDEIQAEAMASSLPFCGCVVPANKRFATPAHMAAVGVYPVDMIRGGGGPALNAHDQPFPAEIAASVLNGRVHVTELICHDLEGTGATPKCAIYHPDRDGKVLSNLLFEDDQGEIQPPEEVVEEEKPSEPEPPQPTAAATTGPKSPLYVKSASAEDMPPEGDILTPPKPQPFKRYIERIEVPWQSRLASEEHIKLLAAELRRFCTQPPYIAYIRAVLRTAHVTKIMGEKKYVRKPRLDRIDVSTKRAIREQERRRKRTDNEPTI